MTMAAAFPIDDGSQIVRRFGDHAVEDHHDKPAVFRSSRRRNLFAGEQ
jgi:hypothetical protein